MRLGGRLFQTCGPATAKVLSPKLLRVQLTSVGRTQLSDTGIGDGEPTVVCQVTRGVAGKVVQSGLCVFHSSGCLDLWCGGLRHLCHSGLYGLYMYGHADHYKSSQSCLHVVAQISSATVAPLTSVKVVYCASKQWALQPLSSG